jgi:GNAT superfamily N-acetyltransferase
MAADGPRIRPFADGDVEGFLQAKCATFEESLPENERRRWRVEFDRNPAAPAPFPRGYVVEEAGAIRGGIAFLPYRLQIGAEIVVGACGIDLCVDRELRGRGLGRELLRRWLDPSNARFAFTIAISGPTIEISRSLGAKIRGGEGGPIAWARHLDAPHAAAPERELLPVEVATALPPDADELEARARRGERLVVVRDAAYLRWRWFEVPFGGVTMLRAVERGATRGLAFVQDDPRREYAFVADLIAAPGDEAARRSLLRRSIAVASARRRKVLWHVTRDRGPEVLMQGEGFTLFEGELPKFIAKVNPPQGQRGAGGAAGGGSNAVRADEWSPSAGDCDMLFNCCEPRPDGG